MTVHLLKKKSKDKQQPRKRVKYEIASLPIIEPPKENANPFRKLQGNHPGKSAADGN